MTSSRLPVFLSGMLLLLLLGDVRGVAQVPGSPIPSSGRTVQTRSTLHPKLDPALERTVLVHRERGVEEAAAVASRTGVDVVDGMIRVVVVCRGGDRQPVRDAVIAAGGRVEGEYADLVQALVPTDRIVELADAPGTDYVRPPSSAQPMEVTSEGVGPAGASGWHVDGPWTGQGVRVAIIDLGFAGLAAAQDSGDLPAGLSPIAFGGAQVDTTSHGTKVAEVINDMAPGAILHLLCVNSEVSLGQAKDWAIAAGARVINMSVGYFGSSRGDGTGGPGTPEAIVADAVSNGIVWVNAAGNHSRKHWKGSFVPAGPSFPASTFHIWGSGDLGNTIVVPAAAGYNSVTVSLKWDDWSAPVNDFDLFLVEAGDSTICSDANLIGGTTCPILAYSNRDQTGAYQFPNESLTWTNGTGSPRTVSVFIQRWSGSGAPRFDLFLLGVPDLQHQTAAGSVVEPATSPSVIAAGAVCWSTNVLEAYSSQGPTIDGRISPDIAGQSVVSTSESGAGPGCSTGFNGTSAAAPHVAGAAALVREAYPAYTPAQVKSYLMARAVDRGPSGADSQYGSGVLSMNASPDPAAIQDLWLGTPFPHVTLERAHALRVFRLRMPVWDAPPPDRFYVTVSIEGGTGDADLYVRSGAPPTTWEFDDYTAAAGNNDRLQRILVGPGPVYVGVYAWEPYADVTVRIDANVTVGPIAQPITIGASNWLNGIAFTPGSVVMMFVPTSGGVVTYGPFPQVENWGTALRFDVPASVSPGNGYASLLVVNTDQGYAESNVEGQLLVGNASLGMPTITSINGVAVNPLIPGVPLANVSTVVVPGTTATLGGTGFQSNPKVNLHTAAGNLGPLTPLAGWTATSLTVNVPAHAPVGPGAFQVVNGPYTGNVLSNAVSAPVGALVTITDVNVAGSTVTVDGTGFCGLTVINLFNKQGEAVVNLGGVNPDGSPKVPLTIVSSTRFTFQRPVSAVAGQAFVQALNPPFIPYSSSGNDPDGAFTMP